LSAGTNGNETGVVDADGYTVLPHGDEAADTE